MSNELPKQPCPRCKGTNVRFHERQGFHLYWRFQIRCWDCGARTTYNHITLYDAEDAWKKGELKEVIDALVPR